MYYFRRLILSERAFVQVIILNSPIMLITVAIILMMIGTKSVVYGAEFTTNARIDGLDSSRINTFNVNDFKINNFGIDKKGNIFLNVIGQAGASRPTNSEQLFSYLFFTNNGIYAATINEETSSIGDATKITLDRKSCITSSEDIGRTASHGNTLVIGPLSPLSSSSASSASALTTRILKVETVQFNIDDVGTCIAKVFDSTTG